MFGFHGVRNRRRVIRLITATDEFNARSVRQEHVVDASLGRIRGVKVIVVPVFMANANRERKTVKARRIRA